MTNSRYEIKLVGSAYDRHEVVAGLLQLPMGLRPLHQPRLVQSLYFDSHDGRAVHDNLAGIADRRKVRLRWYGEAAADVEAQLEVKLRRGGLGDKLVESLPHPVTIEGQLRHRFVDLLQRAFGRAAPIAQQLDGLEPAQWIRYRREYLQTPDRSLRVTIDHDVQAFDQRAVLRLSGRRATPLPALLIVELKADFEHGAVLERFVADLPLRPSKCSKFVMASIPAEAPIVSAS